MHEVRLMENALAITNVGLRIALDQHIAQAIAQLVIRP